ncbi:MAG: phytoene desaturase [Chthonomonas sp.]|nr:phytoene desaturase [Chthonomonas sp.]
MSGRQIAIVGAGMGGLALALRLTHAGHRVTVFEKNAEIGGRNRPQTVAGCRFDSGPTLLMMLDPFRKLFADVGEDFATRVPHKLCDPSYRVFYADGTTIDGTTNLPLMTERIRALAGEKDAVAYPGFLRDLKALYDVAIPQFVRKNYRGLGDFSRPAQLQTVVRHGMLGNLARRVDRLFTDPRIRMLFSFQTMYLGLSPFQAPWVYSTLAYMEYGEGIFYPEGGMARLAETIADLACQRGMDLRLGAEVAGVAGREVALKGGETYKFDTVVFNADMPYAQRQLQGQPPRRKLRYSCSAHMMYCAVEGDLPGLEHHNVFFGPDYRGNLESIFTRLDEPREPAFYACVSSKTDASAAPVGMSNLMVLIPCPNLDYPLDAAATERIENYAFERLNLDRSRIRGIERKTPAMWQSELNLERGAAFGISHDLRQSAFMRPQNWSPQNPDHYFVGASTVPGNGLPMVLISAELAEAAMRQNGVID